VLALTHSFNMDECRQRPCARLLPVRRAKVATPILKLRPVVPSQEEQDRMLQAGRPRPHHRLRRQHAPHASASTKS